MNELQLERCIVQKSTILSNKSINFAEFRGLIN